LSGYQAEAEQQYADLDRLEKIAGCGAVFEQNPVKGSPGLIWVKWCMKTGSHGLSLRIR